jgi:glucose 1-dehydrogenase
MTLAGQAALVTGSGQGIGKAVALRLAREGADIVIDDRRDSGGAENTRKEVEALGRRAVVFAGDVADISQDRKLIQFGIEELGKLDILVNNAGIERHAPFADVTEEEYDAVLDVNLKGAFFVAQAFVRHLQDTHRPGRIINISSVHEDLPFPNFSPYCASKGGLEMVMRTLAVELAPYGITVNNVAPGAIETSINSKLLNSPELLKALLGNIPLGRLGKPDDVAGMVAFLAGPDAGYVTGTTMFVDGGLLWSYSEQ